MNRLPQSRHLVWLADVAVDDWNAAEAADRQWQLLVAQSPAGRQTFVASRSMPNPFGRISTLSRPKQSFGAADFLMVAESKFCRFFTSVGGCFNFESNSSKKTFQSFSRGRMNDINAIPAHEFVVEPPRSLQLHLESMTFGQVSSGFFRRTSISCALRHESTYRGGKLGV